MTGRHDDGGVDDVQVGIRLRALRRRKHWRQRDLADAAGLAQSTISLLERGHFATLSIRALRATFAALDAAVVLDVRWRGGALDRLIDEDHAALVAAMAGLLTEAGWVVRTEVTYSHFGERGSIDLLAFHPATGSLLVVEVKTEIVSAESTLRKLDEKLRLAATIAKERFGWVAATTSRLLVLPDASTARRQVARHRLLFDTAVPTDGRTVRAWLSMPVGRCDGRLFLSRIDAGGAIPAPGGRHRVRVPRHKRPIDPGDG